MNKNDLLNKIKEENLTNDPYEEEVNRMGWKIGALIASGVAIIIFLIEALLFDKYNFGVLIVSLVMLTINSAIAAIKLKHAFQVVMAVILTLALITAIIAYAFCLNYGWV